MLSIAWYVLMPEGAVNRIVTTAGSPPLVSDGVISLAPPTVQLRIVNIEALSPVISMLDISRVPDAVPVL